MQLSFQEWYPRCLDVAFRSLVEEWGRDPHWALSQKDLKQYRFHFSASTWEWIGQQSVSNANSSAAHSSQIKDFMATCRHEAEWIDLRKFFAATVQSTTAAQFLQLLRLLHRPGWRWFAHAVRCERRIRRSEWRDLLGYLIRVPRGATTDSPHAMAIIRHFQHCKSLPHRPLATIPASSSEPRYSHVKAFDGWWKRLKKKFKHKIFEKDNAPPTVRLREIQKKLPDLSLSRYGLFATFNEINPAKEVFKPIETADDVIEGLALGDHYKNNDLIEFRFKTVAQPYIPRVYEAFCYAIDGVFFRPTRFENDFGRTSPRSRRPGFPEVVFLPDTIQIDNVTSANFRQASKIV